MPNDEERGAAPHTASWLLPSLCQRDDCQWCPGRSPGRSRSRSMHTVMNTSKEAGIKAENLLRAAGDSLVTFAHHGHGAGAGPGLYSDKLGEEEQLYSSLALGGVIFP